MNVSKEQIMEVTKTIKELTEQRDLLYRALKKANQFVIAYNKKKRVNPAILSEISNALKRATTILLLLLFMSCAAIKHDTHRTKSQNFYWQYRHIQHYKWPRKGF